MKELTEEERRETLLNTFGSWALEGMYPTEEDLEYARAYIAGEQSITEMIAETVKKYRVSE